MFLAIVKTFVGIAIILGAYLFFLNFVSYVDVPNNCYIALDNDVLIGNQKTTKEAIRIIKKEDPNSYRNLCRYVETISEKDCYTITAGRMRDSKDGCYVKGSKNIYIKPNNGDSYTAARGKADLIKELVQKSKVFWAGN